MRKINTLLLLGVLCPLLSYAQTKYPIALNFLEQNKERLHLKASDIQEVYVTSEYKSHNSDIHHVYLRQKIFDIEIIPSNFNIHLNEEDVVIHYGNRFVSDILKNLESNIIIEDASSAILTIASQMGHHPEEDPVLISQPQGANQSAVYHLQELSNQVIPVKLVFQKISSGKLRLAYDIILSDEYSTVNARVDTQSGEIIDFEEWTLSCNWGSHQKSKNFESSPAIGLANMNFMAEGDYNVYPLPVESPNHGSRSMVTDPSDPVASPYGWHDHDGQPGDEFSITKGNNVHAQLDDDASNSTEGFAPDGGTEMVFDFQIDFNEEPASYDSAAITNLFYWNNIMHDILYHYGFDEPAGNFQYNNYGAGGEEGDYVMADAQDASSSNNANFTTPPDGSVPRMQMFLWNTANPELDGDLDNGIIAHEYGHGVSNRLVGGPNNVSCLGNREQMGEGWSDWLAMLLTMESGDAGEDIRGIGTYALNQPTDGDGVRTYPYSTDMVINPHTYIDIQSESVPHGVGSVWAAMLWELTWELVDEYGFDEDLYTGQGGNNKALALVLEGMKYLPCSPGFIDGRNAILAADRSLYDGVNQCLIWTAFAKRGLGYSADQGDSDDRGDGTESFDLPPDCSISLSVSSNNSVSPGSQITYVISAQNVSDDIISDFTLENPLPDSMTFSSASNGGTLINGVITWSGITLASGQSINRSFVAILSDEMVDEISWSDDVEGQNQYWNTYATNPGLSEWEIRDINPHNGTYSWFANDQNNHNDQYLTTNKSYMIHANSELIFWHLHDTEFRWDGGKVQISLDYGNTWQDLGDHMTQNGYNSFIDNNPSSPAFSGNSVNYKETKVDLSPFEGDEAMIRFWMHTDGSVGDDGWYIDDISLTNVGPTIADTVKASFNGLEMIAELFPTTQVEESSVPVELVYFRGFSEENGNKLIWQTASEINSKQFVIEKSDNTLSNWKTVGNVNAKGNSSSLENYQFFDNTQQSISYYRLKLEDFDGSYEFSNVIRIERSTAYFDDLMAFPNPNSGEFDLSFSLSEETKVDFTIVDLYGKIIWSDEKLLKEKYNRVRFQIGNLSKGIYILKAENGKTSEGLKLVIE